MRPGKTRRRTLQSIAALLAALVAGCSGDGDVGGDVGGGGGGGGGGGDGAGGGAQYGASNDVGLAAGGGQDVSVFRRNVREGYLPQPSALPYEGLFYDYYFDTGDTGECTALFCPTYSTAVTADPLSGTSEQYLSVGLDSGLSGDEFERKTLNLVVVLDVSGSMEESFGEYYYDDDGERQEIEDDSAKIDVATDALQSMTTHLEGPDRLGVVTFSDAASLHTELGRVDERDMDDLREDVGRIRAGGGTNMEAGFDEAERLLEPHEDADPTEYENRIVLLSDAMPNVGQTSNEGLNDRMAEAADRGVYTTFVGVGLDANLNVIDAITEVKGANYYGVRSPEGFRQRLDEEFEYMVTPLAFDVSLSVEGDGYDLANVYGTTADDLATGEVLSIRTLFPSPAEDGRVRGGVVLTELADTGSSRTVEVTAEWTERDGTARETVETVRVDPGEERFDSTGVRKAVLLTRYATLLKNWTRYERGAIDGPPGEGIEPPAGGDDPAPREQESEDLRITEPYVGRLQTFREYFGTEADAVGDDTLDQELDLMATILDAAEGGSGEGTTATDSDETTGTERSAVDVVTPTGWR